jgi:RNA polymerase II-associated protein 1
MARTTNVPVTAALHHHGDEPHAAGYTLNELFRLSRSTILQQRVIALQTLSNIIRQVVFFFVERNRHADKARLSLSLSRCCV